jgi:hypothetical protein
MSRAFAPLKAPQFVSLTPGKSGPAELCIAVHPGGADPAGRAFVTLSDAGSLARVFLGAVRTNSGSVIRHLALRIQRESPVAALPRDRRNWTNPKLSAHFTREIDLNRRLSDSGFTPEWFGVRAPGGENDSSPWAPRMYCRLRKAVFVPRDPESFEELSDCRDDALLANRQLPPWSSGVRRFLYSPARAAAGNPMFYCPAAALDAPLRAAGRGPVSDRNDLVNSFGRIVSQQARIAAEHPSRHSELRRYFPCYECPHKAECYSPSGEATPVLRERLADLSFHGFHLLASELMPLNYDELCDILGGRRQLPESVFYRPWRRDSPLASWDTEPRFGRTFREGSEDGLDLLEMFELKLLAFREAALAVAGHYRIAGRPHLNLHPRHLLADLAGGPGGLPGLWNFRVRLIDPAAAAELDELPGLYAPPTNRVPAYSAPVMQQELFGTRERGMFTILELRQVPGSPAARRIVGELKGELTDPARFSPQDRFGVLLTGLDGEIIELFCRLNPEASGGPTVLSLIGEPTEFPAQRLNHLTALKGVPQRDISYVLYPVLHAPCDLHSLGLLLLRALVVNDNQDLPTAKRLIDAVLGPLNTWAEAVGPSAAEAELLQRFGEFLSDLPGEGAALNPVQMLYAAQERFDGRPCAVPKKYWYEALMLVGRCLTGGPLAFCKSHGDFPADFPSSTIEEMLRRLEALIARVHTLLFHTQPRNAEVRAVVNTFLLHETVPEKDSEGIGLSSRLARVLEIVDAAAAAPR